MREPPRKRTTPARSAIEMWGRESTSTHLKRKWRSASSWRAKSAGMAARQGANMAIPAMFLKFSRADESEADYLGTQYMYAAGYDPTGAVSIFEKIESLNRSKPGAMARIFSTHPMDADRIQKTQK